MPPDSSATADVDKYHNEQEWEAQREIFSHYYKTENRTLKDAAKCMRDKHNFFATPRQWERRIKAWDLNKYVSRQQRLEQFKAEGRDLTEVAQPGRRPRKFSDSKLLPIKDDRNVRRFAKRELSRSPSRNGSRSRSPSVGHQSPGLSPRLDSVANEIVLDERTYDIETSVLSQHQDQISLPAIRTYQSSDNLQAHVLDTQDLSTGIQHTDVFLSIPIDSHDPLPAGHYDTFSSMSNELPLHASMDDNVDPLNAGHSGMPADFYPDEHTEDMDLSQTNTHAANHATWPNPHNISPDQAHTSFGSVMAPSLDSMGATQEHVDTLHFDYQQNGDSAMSIFVIPPPEADDINATMQPHQGPTNIVFAAAEMTDDIEMSSSYSDLSECLQQFTRSIHDVLSSTAVSATAQAEIGQQIEFYKRFFENQLNHTMTNFLASQQRAIQSIQQKNQRTIQNLQQKNQALQNHIDAMFQEKSQAMVNDSASAHATHGHRFSVSGPLTSEYHHLYQVPSRPVTPVGVRM